MELVSILLILGIICIIFTFVNRKSDKEFNCKPKIIYKYVPENLLDIQFGDKNNPSDIYNDMFLSSSPWIGGFGLGNKTFVNDNIESQIKSKEIRNKEIKK